MPKNGNKNEQDFILSDKSKKEYEVGEYVRFSCQLGYFIFQSEFMSTCLADGTWSKISDCKFILQSIYLFQRTGPTLWIFQITPYWILQLFVLYSIMGSGFFLDTFKS